jgi:hypothetical protein
LCLVIQGSQTHTPSVKYRVLYFLSYRGTGGIHMRGSSGSSASRKRGMTGRMALRDAQ